MELDQLMSVVEQLPVQLTSSYQIQYLVQLVQEMADFARLEHARGEKLAQVLVEGLGVDKACDVDHLSKVAWSLVMLKSHLPPPAAASAFSAFIRHCVSGEAIKMGCWRDWSELLDALGEAGVQCSDFPTLPCLINEAVRMFPREPDRSLSYREISMPFSAIVSMGYTGSAQPLLQAVIAAISQGRVMQTARFHDWRKLIRAARELPGCIMETRQLLEQFAAKASDSTDKLNDQHIRTLLNAIRLALWPKTEFVKQLAVRAAGHPRVRMDSSQLAIRLCSLAYLGYLDSSVRSLAVKVAEADLTALKPRDLTNLLHARSMFLALSIQQAVSLGHSQLASEPQLNSMAAALWKECSRREAVGQQWSEQDLLQLHTARQIKDACTGGQTSLTASPPSPSLQEFVAKAISY
ncbi:hypothetical protein V8C86DRAFT_967873 [Haematococcus lacustris]